MLRWAGGLRVQLARLAALLQPGRKVGRRTPQGSTQRDRDVYGPGVLNMTSTTFPFPHTHTRLCNDILTFDYFLNIALVMLFFLERTPN